MKLTHALLIGLVVVILIFSVGALWYRPSNLNIDSSWIVLANVTAGGWDDLKSASWLMQRYGCIFTSINETYSPDPMVNNFGQNVIIVGGSAERSRRLPWHVINRPLIITKPPSQPNVVVDVPTWTTGKISTPKATYYLPATIDEFVTKDYGYITAAYDAILSRWLILISGWTGEATACGVKLFLDWEPQGKFANIQWVIYRRTNPITIVNGVYQPPSLTEWTLSRFTYEVVEIGP